MVYVSYVSWESPDFGRGFLLPLDDICNIGEPVLFSISQVDANRKCWQICGNLNFVITSAHPKYFGPL